MFQRGYRAGRREITKLFDEIFEIYYYAWNARRAIYEEMKIHRFYCLHCGLRFAIDYYEEDLGCPSCTSHYLIKQFIKGA